jgi:monoamine oxidase
MKLTQLIIEGSEHRDIRKWDDFPEEEDVTVAEWLSMKGLYDNQTIIARVKHMTSAVVGREPEETGVQYFLDYIKSGHGFISLITEGEHGAQSLKVKKGKSLSQSPALRNINMNSQALRPSPWLLRLPSAMVMS